MEDNTRSLAAVAALIALLVFQRHCLAQQKVRESSVFAEFDIPTDGMPLVVPVTIHDKAYLFNVQIQLGYSMFDRSLRPLLGDVVRTVRVLGDTGADEMPLYEAPEMRVGKLRARLPAPHPTSLALCSGMSGTRYLCGDDIRGCLGFPFFKDYVVRIDPDRGKLLLLTEVGADAGKALQIEYERTAPTVRVRVAGDTDVRFYIGTGPGVLSGALEGRLAKDLKRRGLLTRRGAVVLADSQGDSFDKYELATLNISEFRHEKLMFMIHPDDSTNDLELRFLLRYMVTFDFPKSVMYLRPSRYFAMSASAPPRGSLAWGVELSCITGETSVRRVLPDTPAARAGVQVADVLLAVDGTDVSSPREFSVHRLFCTDADSLRLKVRRFTGVKILNLTFTPDSDNESPKGRCVQPPCRTP